MHIICTICTDVITQDDLQSMYVTSCGHVFHHKCLTQWTERSPSCPQCRNKITSKLMFRVYLTLSEETKHDNVIMEALLENQAQLNKIIKERDAELAKVNAKLNDRERMLREYENVFEKNERSIAKMKKQLAASKKRSEESVRLTSENRKLRERLRVSVKKPRSKPKPPSEHSKSKKADKRKQAKKRQHKQFISLGKCKRRKDSNGNEYGSSDSMLDSNSTTSGTESDSSGY